MGKLLKCKFVAGTKSYAVLFIYVGWFVLLVYTLMKCGYKRKPTVNIYYLINIEKIN